MVMTSRASSFSHATTLLDRVPPGTSCAPRAGIRALSVVFVAALTAVLSQVSLRLPFTPVPLTLQPLAVLLGAAALGSRMGAMSQILYLMLGVAGLPVFALSPELPQGVLRLLGPTGGYLLAYPVAAFITGALAERGFDRRCLSSIAAMTFGLAVIFSGGVLWLAKDLGLPSALALGFVPFIVVDVLTIAAAGVVLPTVWRFFGR
jgi:biotin transport system substrate-specific component